jgi:hypothetical protein
MLWRGGKLQYKSVSSSTTSITVTGLDKYTWYSFQVLAYTITKDGPLSEAKAGRTRQDGIYRICFSQSFMRLILLIAYRILLNYVFLDMYLEQGQRVCYYFS